jgi:hypothetical protein
LLGILQDDHEQTARQRQEQKCGSRKQRYSRAARFERFRPKSGSKGVHIFSPVKRKK